MTLGVSANSQYGTSSVVCTATLAACFTACLSDGPSMQGRSCASLQSLPSNTCCSVWKHEDRQLCFTFDLDDGVAHCKVSLDARSEGCKGYALGNSAFVHYAWFRAMHQVAVIVCHLLLYCNNDNYCNNEVDIKLVAINASNS